MASIQNREHRSLAMLSPGHKEKRINTDFYVEGLAATFEPYELYESDGIKYYEKIDRNAFIGCDMSDIIMQYDHKGRVLARKSNGSLIVEVTERGLFVAADLSNSNASTEMYQDIASGLVSKMSWSFTIANEEFDRETRTRIIKKVKKIYDISCVSIPANNDTEINARSYFDSLTEELRAEQHRKRAMQLKIKALLLQNTIRKELKND